VTRAQWLGIVAGLWVGSAVMGGPVTFMSADMRADVSVDAITVGGGATSHKEGHDTADLTKRVASAEATASLPFSGLDYPASRGSARANFNPDDAGFRLDGNADAVVFVKSTPFSGSGTSQALTTLNFNLATPGSYDLRWEAGVLATTLSEKTRLNLSLLDSHGTSLALVNLGATISDRQSGTRALDLAAGDYSFGLDAQANADLVGRLGEGDSGNVSYQVSLAPSAGTGGVTIPLPPALAPGLGVLGVAVVVVVRRRRGVWC